RRSLQHLLLLLSCLARLGLARLLGLKRPLIRVELGLVPDKDLALVSSGKYIISFPWYFTAETLSTASRLTCCCCLGVVTVLALKPAWASSTSFLDAAIPAWLVATVWHPATKVRVTMALTILVSVNSFFICLCF